MSIRRLVSIALARLMLCVCCIDGAAAMADTDTDLAAPVTFAVGDGLTARAVQVDAAHISISVRPGGATSRFEIDAGDADAGSSPRFESADYTFNGHRAVAFVMQYGMVNEAYRIFTYDAAARHFVELKVPDSEKLPHGNCGGLSGVTIKAAERTLYSACRSGPMWYTDAYRFDAAGKLYLYQSSADIQDDALQSQLDAENGDGVGPSSQLLTYDATGKVVARRLQAYGGGQAVLHVDVARLPLHDAPTNVAARRYLVKGDVARAGELSGDQRWVKVQYRNPAKGVIDGWVKVDDLAVDKAGARAQ